MITAIELTNFKGIAEMQRIELAPLTLLFGANSAGKSSILHALLYVHELLERGTGEVGRTEHGADAVDLGGFRRLVHRHDLSRPMIIRVELDALGLGLFRHDLEGFPFPDLDDDAQSAWVEITIRAHMGLGAIVESARFGLDDSPEAIVAVGLSSLVDDAPLFAAVNLNHPLLGAVGPELRQDWELAAVEETLPDLSNGRRGGGPGDGGRRGGPGSAGRGGGGAGQPNRGSGGSGRRPQSPAERTGHPIGPANANVAPNAEDSTGIEANGGAIVFALQQPRRSALPRPYETVRLADREEYDLTDRTEVHAQVRMFLDMVMVGISTRLALLLRDLLYIGPLRVIPSASALYDGDTRHAGWSAGAAAWSRLAADPGPLMDATNGWLSRLGAGCQLVAQDLVGAASRKKGGEERPTARRLRLRTDTGVLAVPTELGAGISQMLPVIVAAVETTGTIAMVEQPELHVHPRLQVGLGDLFIEATTRERHRKMMIVETHSEHLILRVLRRIRETAEGDLAEGAPAFDAIKVSVLHVRGTMEGVRIQRLRVSDQGEFTDPWPEGFFDERFAEIYGQ